MILLFIELYILTNPYFRKFSSFQNFPIKDQLLGSYFYHFQNVPTNHLCIFHENHFPFNSVDFQVLRSIYTLLRCIITRVTTPFHWVKLKPGTRHIPRYILLSTITRHYAVYTGGMYLRYMPPFSTKTRHLPVH